MIRISSVRELDIDKVALDPYHSLSTTFLQCLIVLTASLSIRKKARDGGRFQHTAYQAEITTPPLRLHVRYSCRLCK